MTEKAQIETDNLSYYKTVALTFDDGPTRTNSTKVLNSLMEVGAPATFFMIGKNMKPYADLVQRAHDEGHAVASHNWTHGDARENQRRCPPRDAGEGQQGADFHHRHPDAL